jgi:hypothetical protein
MKGEIPKPVIFGAIAVVVIVAAIVGFSFLKSATAGEYVNQTLTPKPWGGPPAGFKPGGPKGAPQQAPNGAGTAGRAATGGAGA